MGKIAFIFPGQGAQYVGMGKDFYDSFESSKEVYKKASAVSGIDVEKICFEENDQINITEYTQITMLTTEIAMLRALEEKGIRPDVTGGLSLGEYGALVASKVIKDEDALRIVRKRGIYMQEAVPSGGAMTAVLGLDTNIIEEVCKSVDGEVTIANYNCPGQIVITGEETSVSEAADKLKEAGAKRCVALNVSGPFHSKLLSEAGERLAKELETLELSDSFIPYIANVTAEYVTNKDEVKELLKKQVSSSVRWQQSVELMIKDGVTTFIEIGPGKTLSGFMRKINRDVTVLNVERIEDINKVAQALAN